MDHHYSTTPSRKGKHLTFEERVIIQTRLKDGLKQKLAAHRIRFETKSEKGPYGYIMVRRQGIKRSTVRKSMKQIGKTVAVDSNTWRKPAFFSMSRKNLARAGL